jgi:DUF1365 family protein
VAHSDKKNLFGHNSYQHNYNYRISYLLLNCDNGNHVILNLELLLLKKYFHFFFRQRFSVKGLLGLIRVVLGILLRAHLTVGKSG